ncbi:MAG: hypothetical protein U5Q03_02195 [Bacteroidota bacterium]|nr:hypothetical protein [Bacteroidota bacterium]
MYIKLISILLMLFAGNSVNAQSKIIGQWKNEDSSSIIEIYQENKVFVGKTISVSDADLNNKTGHLLLDKLTFNTVTKKHKDKVNSTTGMTADCEIDLINENKFQLTVTQIFIHKTQIFIRTD